MDWTDDIEDILKKVRENCITMRAYHLKRYYQYKSVLPVFKIPVLILSALNSVFSVGLQPYMEQSLISVLNCVISLITTIINSIEMYMGIQKSMESEFVSSQGFYILSIDIYKTLSLKRENRDNSGKQYLTECYNLYEELIKKSKLIKDPQILLLDKLQITGDLGVEMYLSQHATTNKNTSYDRLKDGVNLLIGKEDDSDTIIDETIHMSKSLHGVGVENNTEEEEFLKLYRLYKKHSSINGDVISNKTMKYNIPYPSQINFAEKIKYNELNKIKSIGKEYIDVLLDSDMNVSTTNSGNVEMPMERDYTDSDKDSLRNLKINIEQLEHIDLTPGMPDEYKISLDHLSK
jgi:acyl-CoA-binding protein